MTPPPDEEVCVHERQIEQSDGSLLCVVCDHETPAPDPVPTRSFRDQLGELREKLERKAAEQAELEAES